MLIHTHTSHVKVSKNDNKNQTMKNVLPFRINVIFPVFSYKLFFFYHKNEDFCK